MIFITAYYEKAFNTKSPQYFDFVSDAADSCTDSPKGNIAG
jgi:hypothetical protein